MHDFAATIKNPNNDRIPPEFTPVVVTGLDQNGNNAEFLGFLWKEGKPTHIVAKMKGYQWYYNQYNGTQYAPACVQIMEIVSHEVKDGEWAFRITGPIDFTLNKPKAKK